MPLSYTFVSGTQQDTSGNNLPSPPQAPITLVIQRSFGGAPVVSQALGSSGETANTVHVFTADAPYQVVAVIERHSVLGSTTGMLVRALGSTPLGSADAALASTIPHTAAVDVFNSGTLISTGAGSQTVLAKGDALGWRWTTPGNLAPLGGVTVVLERI